MPVISFSKKDMLRGKVVTPAWYRLKIDNVGEAPSADKNSTNYPVEATVIRNADNGSDEFAGVPIDWNFNSKAIGFAKGYLESLGVPVEAQKRYELATSVGLEIEAFVEN